MLLILKNTNTTLFNMVAYVKSGHCILGLGIWGFGCLVKSDIEAFCVPMLSREVKVFGFSSGVKFVSLQVIPAGMQCAYRSRVMGTTPFIKKHVHFR